jgi:hypothetical protein
MIQLLLHYHADPNEGRPDKSTVWVEYLSYLDRELREYGSQPPALSYDLVKAFLTHGADPLAQVQASPAPASASDIIQRIFPPTEAATLLSLCPSRKKEKSGASRRKRPAMQWIQKYIFLSCLR